MEEVSYTKVRSALPAMDKGANEEGKVYPLVRHKKRRLAIMSWDKYEELVKLAGKRDEVTVAAEALEADKFIV